MPHLVESLFNISMNFVVKYINFVDSFIGFPSLIAEEIFKKFILMYDKKDKSIQNILKKFMEAYGNIILERLNLSNNLLILNEHFESIIIISRHITELCVCNCFLGENHDIYSCVWEFECLKKLCLKDNSMTDSSMRLLTLRMRMYGIGGKEIEYLNFADNHFTDDIIPWLTAFPKLTYLNISGSKISRKGVQTLNSQYSLKQISSKEEHKNISNEGWASILLEKWIQECLKKRMQKEKRLIYKRSISTIVKSTPSVSSRISLIFQKLHSSETSKQLLPSPVKKIKLLTKYDVRLIEKDIFSQYR